MASVLVAALAPERGDFKRMTVQQNLHNGKRAAYAVRSREDALDLVRLGVGDDVDILGHAAEQDVAHAAAGKVGEVSMRLEAPRGIERARIEGRRGRRVRLQLGLP